MIPNSVSSGTVGPGFRRDSVGIRQERRWVGQGARGAGGPWIDSGYDEGFGDEPRAAAIPARTPVNDLDDDIPF
jgi:hypothetical protein